MMERKKINVTLDPDTISRLDADVRRRNALAERDGSPRYTRSSLIEHLCVKGMQREQIIERVAGMVPLDATGNLEQ